MNASNSIVYYKPPSSNIQIVTLLKYNPELIINLFTKNMYLHFPKAAEVRSIILFLMTDSELTDKKVYDYFRYQIKLKINEEEEFEIVKKKDINLSWRKKYNDTTIGCMEKKGEKNTIKSIKNKASNIKIQTSIKRAIGRVRDIKSFYKNKPNSYVDVGGGDGSIAAAIKKEYDIIEKEKAVCADIDNWIDGVSSCEKRENIKYVTIFENVPLPFKDCEFCLVTCFQSLHHMKDLEQRMKDITRITKKGGCLIIREHDCRSDKIKMLIDIEHCIFELVLSKQYNQRFIDTYYGNYKSKEEWNRLFEFMGFKYINSSSTIIYPKKYERYNPTLFFYALYKKK